MPRDVVARDPRRALYPVLLYTLACGSPHRSVAPGVNAGTSPPPSASSSVAAGGALGAKSAGASGSANTAATAADGGAATAGSAHAAGSSANRGDAGSGTTGPTAKPNEWRMMGYDEKNWYFNPHETTLSVANAKQLIENWRFTVSGLPLGTPIIADAKVFAMATGGTYAIDFETGRQIWVREDLIGNASPVYSDGFVFVQNSAPPGVYKLNASDGTTVWGPILNCNDATSCTGESSPVLAGDTVYIGMENNLLEASLSRADAAGARGGVRALDTNTGELRWLYYTIPDSNPSGENGAAVWSSSSVDTASGTVFATTGNNYTIGGPNSDAFHAIDLATGTPRWVRQVRMGDVSTVADVVLGTTLDLDFGANPILAEVNGRPVVAAGDKGGTFWELDRETGQILWSRDDLSKSHDAVSGGIFINGGFDGNAYYVVSNEAQSAGAVLHRLDPTKNGASTWSQEFTEATWGALSLANGLLFVPNNATLYVMNAETGELLTKLDTGGTIAGGAPAIAQGRVVVKSGFVYSDPKTKANDQIICYALPQTSMTQGAGGTSGGAGSSGLAAPPVSASFSAIHRSIMVAGGCTSGQCHSAAAAGALDLTSRDIAYSSLVSVRAMGIGIAGAAPGCSDSGLERVEPGNPDRSLLVAKLEHTQTCGGPMPNAGTRLPAAQIEQVRAWITAGAPND